MSRSVSETVENFLNKLEKVKQNGENWSAQCPCRSDDQNPSLSVGQGSDGRVLVTCHRGIPCSVEEICESVGLTVSDLMPPSEMKKKDLKLTATYSYRDKNGTLLFQKLRFVDENGRKTFRQRKPVGDGDWSYNLDGVDQVLYNLPAVVRGIAAGETIFVVEGEKDAETLSEMGLISTTMPGGAGKWREHHTETLRGAQVKVLADNDTVGKKHATDVAEALTNAGCTVEVLIADGVKDVTDLIQTGGTLADLRRLEPEIDLVDPTAIYQPIIAKLEKILYRDDLSDNLKFAKAELILAELLPETQAKPTGKLATWSEFIGEDVDDSYDWVIPDVLERSERLMVVASEGVGKTVLARQVALLSAAGINPFTFERMKPVRTLMVDLENPQRIIRRTSRDIYEKSLKYKFCSEPQSFILTKPDGLDLMKSSDRAYLEQAIEETKPDILFLGPLYKAFIDPGGRTSESIAIEVAKYFDSLREWFKCSLWLEHHAPLGSSMGSRDLRPFGSAVWSRWPEFGLSLQPDPTATEGYVYEVRHFRGARDKRRFPVRMTRGKLFPFEVLEFARMD
jgi:5S rRNA maturation endonuclease (ribonuclease M5)